MNCPTRAPPAADGPEAQVEPSSGTRFVVRGNEIPPRLYVNEVSPPYVGPVELNFSRLTSLLPPAVGVAYFALWTLGEAGRLGSATLLFLAFGAVIAVSRKWPSVALGLAGAVLLLQLAVEGARFGASAWPAYLPLLYAVFNVSAYGRRLVSRVCLPVAAAYAISVALLLTLPVFGAEGWPVFYSVEIGREIASPANLDVGVNPFIASVIAVGLATGAWCAGLAMRFARRALNAKLRAQELAHELIASEEELVALSERDRLAQDVHDVMAHSLAVIAAQADGTRMTGQDLTRPTQDALTTIAELAREGLQEMRQLLDATPAEQAQDLRDVAGLVERVRTAGHDCQLAVLGNPKHLTPAQQLSVYRIVQEALTNALKHSGAQSNTRATLDWRGPGLAILIATTPEASTAAARPGHGIRGMQERARLAGGWLTADADGSGIFIVNAFIPTREAGTDEVAA